MPNIKVVKAVDTIKQSSELEFCLHCRQRLRVGIWNGVEYCLSCGGEINGEAGNKKV